MTSVRRRRREAIVVCLALLALGAVQVAGALRHLPNSGARDWNYFLGQSQAEVDTLLRFGRFPLWSPWQHGGQPGFAQPEAMLLSPVTPLALLVGPLLAYKLLLLPTFLACGLGMWRLAGHLGLEGVARAVPALVLLGSSVFPLFLTAGLPNWLFALAILPWTFLALRKAADAPAWSLALGAGFAGLLFCGGLYQFVFAPVFLVAAALAQCLERRSPRPLLAAGLGLVAGAALAAPRLLPLAELHAAYPREHASTGASLPAALWARIWLGTELPDLSTRTGPFVVTRDGGVYWTNVGAYIGPVGALLAVAGLFAWRRAWWPAVAVVLGTWLAMGQTATPSLWNLLHRLPVYSSMRAPQRLVVFATFGIALLAGCGWSLLARATDRWARGTRRAAGAILLAALMVPMLVVNAPIARSAFPLPPSDLPREAVFVTRRLPDRPPQWGGAFHDAVLANVGNPTAITDVPTPDIILAEGDPGYRGELWLDAGKGRVEGEIRPGRIELRADLDADDTLVVNQNAFPGWRVEPLTASDGPPAGTAPRPLSAERPLLSLPLSAGRHDLALVYAPRSVPLGFALGGVAMLGGAGYLLARRRAARRGPPRAATFGAPEAGLLVVHAGVLVGLALALPPSRGDTDPAGREDTEWLAGALRVDPALARDDPSRGRFRDLVAALAAAPDGGALLLAPGRYPGVRIDRPVALLAVPGDQPVVFAGRVLVGTLPADGQVALVGPRDGRLVLDGGLRVATGPGRCLVQGARLAPGLDPDDGTTWRPALFAHDTAWLQLTDVELEEAPDLAPRVAAPDGGTLRVDAAALLEVDALFARTRLVERGRARTTPVSPALLARGGTLQLNAADWVRERDGAPALELTRTRARSGPGRLGSISLRSGADLSLSGVDLRGGIRAANGSGATWQPDAPSLRLVESRFLRRSIQVEVSGRPGAAGVLVIAPRAGLGPVPGQPGTRLVADPEGAIARLDVTLDAEGRADVRTRVPEALLRPGAGLVAQFLELRDDGLHASPPDAWLHELLDPP